ncbi:hypothetical protein [Streptomyces sp. SD15]
MGVRTWVSDWPVYRQLTGADRRRVAGRPYPGGLALPACSVCTRIGVFAAGIASAEDPKYTVVPERKGR